MIFEPRIFLRQLFDAAVAVVQPESCVPAHIPRQASPGRLIVLAAGKAAAAMAQAVETHWAGELTGVAVTRDGHGLPCRAIKVVEASHPVPDARGVAAAQHILQLASNATERDFILCLLSGGASALMAVPAAGIGLEEKRDITAALLKSGAAIGEINAVRKHLSSIKGGRLAAAAFPAPVRSLIISDVVGDDPAIIASGPTAPDPTTCADALAILDRYAVSISPAVHTALAGGTLETPKALPGNVENIIVARPEEALAAAAAKARAAGLAVLDLGDAVEGTAAAVAARHAKLACNVAGGRGPVKPPCVILSGGELTVRVRGKGRGGPNTEYALALALALDGTAEIFAIACDTDGSDGNSDAAGAIITPDTCARLRRFGVDGAKALAENDSAAVFEAIGDLIVTGPTHTNVNDFRAILVLQRPGPPG